MPGTNTGDQPFTNHLIHENSPYLLSHAHNPVDWYPWGPEALRKAVSENKPIFLSIGYAACHWCHVMERESFEDHQTATLLNEHFVSIKVDREQRPDLDQIYMAFTMAMTGQGGWPMSVFLTPDRKPFFAGTYFPPEDRMGRPGFRRVITEVARSYHENGEAIVASAENIFKQVSLRLQGDFSRTILSPEMVSRSAEELLDQSDKIYGGFGAAPKFPHSLELSLLLRQYRKTGDLRFLQATQKALDGMARGGIYDHLAGGFARYSVDQKWLVPHFEKMLYDNALLVAAYTEAYQVTGKETYLTTVRETLDFLLREMADSTGGFYSALDADSEGEEGKFYTWRKDEIDSLLGHDTELFCQYYNVTEAGNFEGRNILNLDAGSERLRRESGQDDVDARLAHARKALLAARSKRVRPLTDDKILTSWNGLTLSALCRGYQVTSENRYLEAALKNAAFVRRELFRHGKLTHSYRKGKQSTGEFLEDYAAYIKGLLDLYESHPSPDNHQWLDFACKLADQALAVFVDSAGLFYLRPDNQADLILRPKDETDGSTPAPGSNMISNLLRLNRLTGQKSFLDAAERSLKAISGALSHYRGGMTSALLALDDYYGDKVEIVLIGQGPERTAMLQDIYRRFLPNRIVAMHPTGHSPLPLFEGRTIGDSGVSAYVCINSACKLPAATADELRRQLDAL